MTKALAVLLVAVAIYAARQEPAPIVFDSIGQADRFIAECHAAEATAEPVEMRQITADTCKRLEAAKASQFR